jgi:hypothetical protein
MSSRASSIRGTGRLLLATGGDFVFTLDKDHLAPAPTGTTGFWDDTSEWTYYSDEGVASNNMSDVVYDPTDPDHRLHEVGLDQAYGYLDWDDTLHLVTENHKRDGVNGYCEYSTFGATSARYSSYARRIIRGQKADGTRLLYVAANGSGVSGVDGAIYKGTLDTASGRYLFAPAMGDTGCSVALTAGGVCYYACSGTPPTSPAAGQLPKGHLWDLAVAPSDPDHLRVVAARSATNYVLYDSTDGGNTWSDISSIYKNAAGASLGELGDPTDLVFDPQNPSRFFVAYGNCGIYMNDQGDAATKNYFINITNAAIDNPGVEATLVEFAARKCTIGGVRTNQVAPINDIEPVVGGDGVTRLYLGVGTICGKTNYGTGYPGTPCDNTEAGGVYVGAPGAGVVWQKLNHSSAVEFFNTAQVTVSPADPSTIVATGGFARLDWKGYDFYYDDAQGGIMFSRDGGATWTLLSSTVFNAGAIDSHPSNPDRFLVAVQQGLWQLDLICRDTDHDHVCNEGAGPIDCAPTDPSTWAIPSEALNLNVAQSGADATLTWDAPVAPGGSAPTYDVIRSDRSNDFTGGASCLESGDGADRTATDSATPTSIYYYLVRPLSACGAGITGTSSNGSPRTARTCP